MIQLLMICINICTAVMIAVQKQSQLRTNQMEEVGEIVRRRGNLEHVLFSLGVNYCP